MDYALADFDFSGVNASGFDLEGNSLPPYDAYQGWPDVVDTSRNNETYVI